MKTSKALKEERAAKFAEQQQLVEAAKNEKGEARDFTPDEEQRFDALTQEIDEYKKKIERAEAFEANQRAAAAAGTIVDSGERKEKEKLAKRFSLSKALLRGANGEALDGVEAEINAIAKEEARNAGVQLGKQTITIPESMMRAVGQTVTLDSGTYGSELVETSVKLIQSLYPKVPIEALGATMLNGLVGDVALPRIEDYTFAWLAEDADTTGQKQTFTGPTLSPKRAAAQVPISYQLLQQTSFAVDQMITDRLRIGGTNALMTAIINGTGVTDPLGILNKTGVQAAADSSAVAPTWAKMVELEGLVKAADGTGMGYIMHPKTEAKLKTTPKDAGSGLFLIENGKLNGYPYIVSSLVPALNTGTTYPLIFGDFSEYFVGMWGGMSFLSDPYTGAAGNKVKIHVNMHADANTANPEAFAVNTWLTF